MADVSPRAWAVDISRADLLIAFDVSDFESRGALAGGIRRATTSAEQCHKRRKEVSAFPARSQGFLPYRSTIRILRPSSPVLLVESM